MQEVDFNPARMTLATVEDVERMYRQLWGCDLLGFSKEKPMTDKLYRAMYHTINSTDQLSFEWTSRTDAINQVEVLRAMGHIAWVENSESERIDLVEAQ